MNMANRIQALRKSKGISQEELADKTGVSRQAVSKWESGQSSPDTDKIILLSEYFDVTADYLLKGTESTDDMPKNKNAARIFSVAGTALNLIGLISACAIWAARKTPLSAAAGIIIMVLGCTVFAIGQFIGCNRKTASVLFWSINIWMLTLIPVSCIFNCASGLIDRHWWTFSPIPQLWNSIAAYKLCWVIYFAICTVFDIVMLKSRKR